MLTAMTVFWLDELSDLAPNHLISVDPADPPVAAAGLDGGTPWKRFSSITWPMMAPAVTVNVLFAVIGSLTTYNLIYILTDGDYGTNTLGMLAFNSGFGGTPALGLGAAVTVALLVVAICVAVPLALLLRYRERRLLA